MCEYRGSLVHLEAGTSYEIMLSLADSGTTRTLTADTWSDTVPVAKTIELPESSNNALVITESGTAEGYIVYTAAANQSATIDVNHNADQVVEVRASHIILRGLTLKNGRLHGIRLFEGAHDIIIEENDISGWGRIAVDGWGEKYDSGIYSSSRPLEHSLPTPGQTLFRSRKRLNFRNPPTMRW